MGSVPRCSDKILRLAASLLVAAVCLGGFFVAGILVPLVAVDVLAVLSSVFHIHNERAYEGFMYSWLVTHMALCAVLFFGWYSLWQSLSAIMRREDWNGRSVGTAAVVGLLVLSYCTTVLGMLLCCLRA